MAAGAVVWLVTGQDTGWAFSWIETWLDFAAPGWDRWGS
jgi:hypothetical protein